MRATLVELVPEFVAELEAALRVVGHTELSAEVPLAELDRWAFDESCDAVYLYVSAGRELNAIEKSIIGVKHGQTIPVGHRYWVNVDTDNFGRLRGIEVLNGRELAAKLGPAINPN
jgi:hypothetical protein